VELQTRLLHHRLVSPDSENGSRRDLLALHRGYRRSHLHHPRPWIPSGLPLLRHGSCSSHLTPAIDPVGASSPSDVDLVGVTAASTRAMYLVGATSPPAIDPVGASSPSNMDLDGASSPSAMDPVTAASTTAMDLVGATSPATTTHRARGSSTGSDDGARATAVGSDRARQGKGGEEDSCLPASVTHATKWESEEARESQNQTVKRNPIGRRTRRAQTATETRARPLAFPH
jgi:hypothetical protein